MQYALFGKVILQYFTGCERDAEAEEESFALRLQERHADVCAVISMALILVVATKTRTGRAIASLKFAFCSVMMAVFICLPSYLMTHMLANGVFCPGITIGLAGIHDSLGFLVGRLLGGPRSNPMHRFGRRHQHAVDRRR